MGEDPGYVRWRGKVWLKYREVERCWLACGARPFGKRARPFGRRARPFGEGGALVACLVGGLVISSFSFVQLRVDDN
jgi:hypothetical protein